MVAIAGGISIMPLSKRSQVSEEQIQPKVA
jgi:hypothetical protein